MNIDFFYKKIVYSIVIIISVRMNGYIYVYVCVSMTNIFMSYMHIKGGKEDDGNES